MTSSRKRDSCFILQGVLFRLIQPDDQLALRATSLMLSGWCVNLTTNLYKVPNLGMLGSLFFYGRTFQSNTSGFTSYNSLWHGAVLSTERCYIDEIPP